MANSKVVTISVNAVVEEKFRRVAKAVHGMKKGYLGKALTEAMDEWTKDKEKSDAVAAVLRLLDQGVDLGGIKYSTGMNYMSVETDDKRHFVDTNILAYAFDQSEKKKRKICAKLVRAAFQGESNSYLSNQILCELFVVLTSKVAKPLSNEKASTIVRGFIDSAKWNKTNYDHTTVRESS